MTPVSNIADTKRSKNNTKAANAAMLVDKTGEAFSVIATAARLIVAAARKAARKVIAVKLNTVKALL